LTQEKHQARLNVLLERQPKAIVVSLDLTSRVDKDGSDALGKAMKQIAEKGLQVELCLPAALEKTVVGKAAWVEGLQAGGHVHRRRLDALRAAQIVIPDASEASKTEQSPVSSPRKRPSPQALGAQSEAATLAKDF
jgi:hypothetical protein